MRDYVFEIYNGKTRVARWHMFGTYHEYLSQLAAEVDKAALDGHEVTVTTKSMDKQNRQFGSHQLTKIKIPKAKRKEKL